MIKEPAAYPLAYFISFTCYGTWKHGEDKGSVDCEHNQPGTPFLPPNFELREEERSHMQHPPYLMDQSRRAAVRDAIVGVCRFRGWDLHAVYVRSNHVHVVVAAQAAPEKVINDFKAYASRSLNHQQIDEADRKRWSRHGSTRYLWDAEHVNGAIDYVLHRQGEPMAVFPDASTEPRP